MSHSHCSCHKHNNHCCTPEGSAQFRLKEQLPLLFSSLMLFMGLLVEHFSPSFFSNNSKLSFYVIAYLPVALPVIKSALSQLRNGSFFNEFTLMTMATLGAFYLGEYAEGVGVMLFYTLGEWMQDIAVQRARNNIEDLLSMQVEMATIYREGKWIEIPPAQINVGEKLRVKAGEKIPVDGVLLSEEGSFNTAALTGESTPLFMPQGETVLSGTINLEQVIEIQATQKYENSALSRVLKMVENATERKAKTELLIRKFAKIYTPIVFALSTAICILPIFFTHNYIFTDWFSRALVFLVISCPCALVISVPLSYFGGLGAASQNGILFKGATYLDTLLDIKVLALDKTGTLTKGIFVIKEIKTHSKIAEENLMAYAQALEKNSTHPIAMAIKNYPVKQWLIAKNIKEYPGKGITGEIEGKKISIGNRALFDTLKIKLPLPTENIVETVVFVAIDNQYAGYIIIADELKNDAKQMLEKLKKEGIRKFVILSGDKSPIVAHIAKMVGIEEAKGELLPEEKLNEIEQLKTVSPKGSVAFIGDGINDAPVIAASDVGIAMGGLGSDIAIETADIVIQTDEPSKLATAIRIAKHTRRIIKQNIVFILAVKIAVMLLAAVGYANMWSAVFADVGVALLAVLNAVRLLKMNFTQPR